MSRKLKCLLAVLFGFCVGALLANSQGYFFRSGWGPENESPICSHWSTFHLAELHGLPIDMRSLVELMPVRSRTSSFADIQLVLKGVGLNSRVRTGVSVQEMEFPAVAHLTEPDHFVVVLSKSDTDVHLLDNGSQRLMVSLDTFEERFSGNILTVLPHDEDVQLGGTDVAGPQFDTLRVDVGRVAMSMEPLDVEFRFRNVGRTRLHIDGVSTSCGCLKGASLKDDVEPGESSCVNVEFLPNVGSGAFEHEIIVQTNAANGVRVLKVSGVLARPTSVPEIIYVGEVVIGKPNETVIGASGAFDVENISISVPGVELGWRNATSSELDVYASNTRKVSCSSCGRGSFAVITLAPQRGVLPGAFDGLVTFNSPGTTETLESRVIGRFVRPFEVRPERVFVDSRVDELHLTVVPKISGAYRIVRIESPDDSLGFEFDAGPQEGTSTVSIVGLSPSETLHGTTASVQIHSETQADDVVLPISFYVARWKPDAERAAEQN